MILCRIFRNIHSRFAGFLRLPSVTVSMAAEPTYFFEQRQKVGPTYSDCLAYEGQFLAQLFILKVLFNRWDGPLNEIWSDVVVHTVYIFMVSMAQGKREIWIFIFPDMENTANFPKKIIKDIFFHWEFTSAQRKFFEILKIKGWTRDMLQAFVKKIRVG